MAQITHDCPHCSASRSAMPVVGQGYGRRENYFFCVCPTCVKPIVFELAMNSGGQIGLVSQDPFFTPERYDLHVIDFWPKPPLPNLPEALPPQVAKAFMQAEDNFHRVGMEEVAAGAYGRALDVGTKIFVPEHAGQKLNNRIDKMRKEGLITQSLWEWAHLIKSIRNDALHEIESISRDELEAIRGFTETLLTYLFTLPSMLAERKAAAAAGLSEPPEAPTL